MSLAEELACNSPKKTPGHKTKSHVVKACEKGIQKIIRFGQQGVKGSPKKKGESEADRKRRKSFKARHKVDKKKLNKFSALYWSNKVKWTVLLPVLSIAESNINVFQNIF